MVHDLRNLQTNYPPVLVTNIMTSLDLYVKNEVAAKLVRVYIPMLCVSTGHSKITDTFVLPSLVSQ